MWNSKTLPPAFALGPTNGHTRRMPNVARINGVFISPRTTPLPECRKRGDRSLCPYGEISSWRRRDTEADRCRTASSVAFPVSIVCHRAVANNLSFLQAKHLAGRSREVASTSYQLHDTAEEFLAELTDAACRVTLKHGQRGSFLNVQLDLWTALRAVLGRKANVSHLPAFTSLADPPEQTGRPPVWPSAGNPLLKG